MIKNGTGGANTKTGLAFENKADLITLFCEIDGYEVRATTKKIGSND